MRWLRRQGVLARSPAEDLATPKVRRPLPTFLSVDAAKEVVESPDTDVPSGLRDRAILELLYGSGLRVAELCGLDVGCVDLRSGTARVVGKGNKERIVPLGRASVQALARRFSWPETHSRHVARLSLELFGQTRELHGLDDTDRELLEYAALLHDDPSMQSLAQLPLPTTQQRERVRDFRNRVVHGDDDLVPRGGQGLATATLEVRATGIVLQTRAGGSLESLSYADLTDWLRQVYEFVRAAIAR